jgi:hypothetical protein
MQIIRRLSAKIFIVKPVVFSGFILLVSLWIWQVPNAAQNEPEPDPTVDPYPEWLQALNVEFAEGVELVAGEWKYTLLGEPIETFGDVQVDYLNFELTLADGQVIELPKLWLSEGFIYTIAHIGNYL